MRTSDPNRADDSALPAPMWASWANPGQVVEAVIERLLAAVGEEGKEEIMTAGEKLIERGRQEGRREGRQEGRHEGQREERRALLLKLLGTRFGALPESIVTRVQAADLAELDRWFERGIAAPALVAVFDEA